MIPIDYNSAKKYASITSFTEDKISAKDYNRWSASEKEQVLPSPEDAAKQIRFVVNLIDSFDYQEDPARDLGACDIQGSLRRIAEKIGMMQEWPQS